MYESSAVDGPELAWFKSSYSSSSDGEDCVEVALAPDTIHIRDSKNRDGDHLDATPRTWAAFVSYAAAGYAG